MNWKPEVKVAGDAKWYDNALVFATQQEALDNARNLMGRWTLVTEYRAAESNDRANYRWVDGNLVAIAEDGE